MATLMTPARMAGRGAIILLQEVVVLVVVVGVGEE
jgi:hypothetical protein